MSKKKIILVTGSTGFVGSHMVDFLIKKKNYKIYTTKRYHLSKLQFTENFFKKVNWVDCDLTDPVATEKLITRVKPDLLFHFAAESFVSPSWDHPHRYMSVNYNSTVKYLYAKWNNSEIVIIQKNIFNKVLITLEEIRQ